jgi:plasmid stability protein
MAQLKRATVYFEPSLHQALRVKAAHCDRSVSDLVNAAIRRTLAEDADDLATFERRRKEPVLSFEEVLKDMKKRGAL